MSSSISLGKYGGIRERIRALNVHMEYKLTTALKQKLQLLHQSLREAMTKEPLEGMVIFSKTIMEWRKFDLIKDLIEYLDENSYENSEEQILALRVLQRHVEMGNINANDFSSEEAREFMTDHAGRMIAIINSL
ncbi:MAG: hypothetical protein Q7R89_02590 [bacterium]|nr:hypothetical protein [bacterium]